MSLRTGDQNECPSGHKFTPDNTYIHPTGKRRCRQCGRDKQNAKRRANGMKSRAEAALEREELRRKRLSKEGHITGALNRKINQRQDFSWHDDALCKGMDVNLFFGPDIADFDDRHEFTAALKEQEKEAKKLCVGCPVMLQCRAANLMEETGVFGGLTPSERRRMLNRADMDTTEVPAVIDDPNHVPVVPKKRRSNNASPEVEAAVLEAYRSGLGYKAAAKLVGCHHSTVRRVVEREGIMRTPQEQAEAYDRAMERRRFETIAKIREKLKEGLTAQQVSDGYGIGRRHVYQVQSEMRKFGELPPGDGRSTRHRNEEGRYV